MSYDAAKKFSDDFSSQFDKAGSSPASAAFLTYMLRYINNFADKLADDTKSDMVIKRLKKWADSSGDDCIKFQVEWARLGGLSSPLPSSINSQAKSLLVVIKNKAENRKEELKKQEAENAAKVAAAAAYATGEAKGIAEANKAIAAQKEAEAKLAKAQAEAAKLANDNPSGKKVRTTESVSIRSEPKVDKNNVLTKAKSGEILDISTKNTGGEWTRVMHKGGGAWVATKYLKDVVETVTPKGDVKVKTTKPTSTKPVFVETTPAPAPEESVSTGAKIGIGVGALAVIGGIIYFATRGK